MSLFAILILLFAITASIWSFFVAYKCLFRSQQSIKWWVRRKIKDNHPMFYEGIEHKKWLYYYAIIMGLGMSIVGFAMAGLFILLLFKYL
jgi:hypothetical protein